MGLVYAPHQLAGELEACLQQLFPHHTPNAIHYRKVRSKGTSCYSVPKVRTQRLP
jgi:hypothetical protein